MLYITKNITPCTDSEIFRLLNALSSEVLCSFSVPMNFHSSQPVNEGNSKNGRDPTPTLKIMGIFHRFYGPKFEMGFLAANFTVSLPSASCNDLQHISLITE